MLFYTIKLDVNVTCKTTLIFFVYVSKSKLPWWLIV